MAADPSVAERAYSEIKRKLLDGGFHLRQRLDAGALANALGASTTPVREALVRLAAERLIVSRPTRGYHVALWGVEQLTNLYAWRASLAEQAAESLTRRALGPVSAELAYPWRVTALLSDLSAKANPELIYASANADERLHHARRAEHELWPDADEELMRLAEALNGAPAQRRVALGVYHRRRLAHVRQIRERALVLALPNGK